MQAPKRNPLYDPGRTTAEPDFAVWAFEHRLKRAGYSEGASVYRMQHQSKNRHPCSIKAMISGQHWLLDNEETPLVFSIRFDSMRPWLVLEMHFVRRPRNGESVDRANLFKDPSQIIRAEFPVYDERDYGDERFAGCVVSAFTGDGPHPNARTSFCRQVRDLQSCTEPIEQLVEAGALPTHWDRDKNFVSVTWKARGAVRYNWNISQANKAGISRDCRFRLEQFKSTVDRCEQEGCFLKVVTRYNADHF